MFDMATRSGGDASVYHGAQTRDMLRDIFRYIPLRAKNRRSLIGGRVFIPFFFARLAEEEKCDESDERNANEAIGGEPHGASGRKVIDHENARNRKNSEGAPDAPIRLLMHG